MAVPLMLTMTPSGGRVSRLAGDLSGIGGVLAMFDCRPPCPHRVRQTETGPSRVWRMNQRPRAALARGSCDAADARDGNAGELGLCRRLVLRTVVHQLVKFEILRHVPMIMETGLISKEIEATNDSGIRGKATVVMLTWRLCAPNGENHCKHWALVMRKFT